MLKQLKLASNQAHHQAKIHNKKENPLQFIFSLSSLKLFLSLMK